MTVARVSPQLLSLAAPDLLRNLPGWLIWRMEPNGDKKPRKLPYYVSGVKRQGVQGSPEDRQQLVTFDQAKAAAARKGFDGVGFAPMPEWGITALDFDNCVDGSTVHPQVLQLVGGTYAEFSPSGSGVRAFMRGDLGNRKDAHSLPFGVETFSSKGFVTFTGNALPIVDLVGTENTVAPVPPAVVQYCAQRFGRAPEPLEFEPSEVKPLGLSREQIQQALAALPKDFDYDTWVKVGMAVHHETAGEGFDLWDAWSSTSPKYSTSEYGEERWRSFGRNPSRPVTAGSLVRMANAHGAGIDLNEFSLDDFDDVSQADSPAPLIDTAAQPAAKPNRFAVEPAGRFADRPAPEWIIKEVLPKAELAVLFGESGSGKSFVALDMAGAIARGLEWRGKRTRQGRVVYIAAEGAGGFRNRLKAYALHNSLDLGAFPFGVIHAAPNMLLKDDALDVAKAIVAAGGADVVIVDTWAQVTPGANENAAEDMGKALGHCKGIHRATGALVMLVHHAGKDAAKGARGWSGLKAAADAELEVIRMPAGRMLRSSKQKDGEDGLEWGFGLEIVPVGTDSDGDPITSCVVVEAAVPEKGRDRVRSLGPMQALINAVVQEFATVQTAGIEIAAVTDECVRRDVLDEDDKKKIKQRKQDFRKALLKMCEGDDKLFTLEDGCISIP